MANNWSSSSIEHADQGDSSGSLSTGSVKYADQSWSLWRFLLHQSQPRYWWGACRASHMTLFIYMPNKTKLKKDIYTGWPLLLLFAFPPHPPWSPFALSAPKFLTLSLNYPNIYPHVLWKKLVLLLFPLDLSLPIATPTTSGLATVICPNAGTRYFPPMVLSKSI